MLTDLKTELQHILVSKIKVVRKSIARVMTVISQNRQKLPKNIGLQVRVPSEAPLVENGLFVPKKSQDHRNFKDMTTFYNMSLHGIV